MSKSIGTLYMAHGWGPPTQPYGLTVQAKLEAKGVEIINPFQREEQGLYDMYAAKGLPYPPDVCEQIVNGDLDKIDQSDGIIAIPGEKSIGTFMEIFYASYLYEKPVWTLWLHGKRADGEGDRHPWLDHLTKLYVGGDKEQAVIDDILLYFSNLVRVV
jgi:hypothetical protein